MQREAARPAKTTCRSDMNLVRVVRYLNEPRMVVIAVTPAGQYRKVELSWESRDGDSGIPPKWWETVVAEIQYQDSQARIPEGLG